MTPKEKSLELVEKFYDSFPNKSVAIEAALIAVDEIIKALRKDLPEIGLGKGYWSSVKKEIDKL